MSNPPKPPQETYACPNPWCPRYLRKRTITLQHVGHGLYMVPDQVVCECGTHARTVR